MAEPLTPESDDERHEALRQALEEVAEAVERGASPEEIIEIAKAHCAETHGYYPPIVGHA